MRIFALPQVQIDGKLGSSCKQWEVVKIDMSDHIEVHSLYTDLYKWSVCERQRVVTLSFGRDR